MSELGIMKRSIARRVLWSRVALVLPAIVLGCIILLAIIVPLVSTQSPTRGDLGDRFTPPVWLNGGSSEHLLGTDHLGRDVLIRAIYGARTSLVLALVVVGFSALLGTILGMVSGLRGGMVDSLCMAVVEVTLSLPLVLLAIVFAVAVGPGAVGLVVVLCTVFWAQYARIARGETLALKNREFVIAAISLGYRDSRIIFRHVLPNLAHTIVVVATLQIGNVILIESSLSFLGVGVPPPTPTWGRMIADGRNYLEAGWWSPVFAGLALAIVIVCINLLGDWLRDRFDPQLTHHRSQSVF